MREIVLRARDGSERARVLVDDEDFEWLSRYRWKLTAKGYAQRERYQRGGGWKSIRMHRAVLGLGHGDPRQGDHVNGDRLDNRRENLRIIPASGQAQNVRRRSDLPRGVVRSGRGFVAQVRTQGKTYRLGTYASAAEAAEVARAWRAEHMPFAMD